MVVPGVERVVLCDVRTATSAAAKAITATSAATERRRRRRLVGGGCGAVKEGAARSECSVMVTGKSAWLRCPRVGSVLEDDMCYGPVARGDAFAVTVISMGWSRSKILSRVRLTEPWRVTVIRDAVTLMTGSEGPGRSVCVARLARASVVARPGSRTRFPVSA